MSGPTPGRRWRADRLRALPACVALLLLATAAAVRPAMGQALTSQALTSQASTSDVLRPVVPGGFTAAQDISPRRSGTGTDLQPPDAGAMAPSRIGRPLTYGNNAAFGASDTGFDSLNRKRKKPKPYPGAPKRRGPIGPGNAVIIAPPPAASAPPSFTANKPPVAAAIAGTVEGQPQRRRLKPDNDPFGAVGVYVGSFLVKTAVEISGGYDSNPARFTTPRGSSFYQIAPELLAASDWSRHSLIVDLRGSYTGYGQTFPAPDGQISGAPVNIDRPDFTGKIDGRLDVTHDTRINSELRLRVGTDNPGSPNIQAGLEKYPLYATVGGTLGVEQDFNRLQVKIDGNADRTSYQDSLLTNGVSTTNEDRNFDQFGAVARVSYQVLPGLRPFGEVEGDTRVHDVFVDRFGYQRDSNGGYVKAGTTFEFSRLVTGEVSIGYAARSYSDPRLQNLAGLLTSASVTWAATPLTTAKFISTTSLDETTLPGVPGVLTRIYTFEVDHDFRRWLTAVGRFSFGTQDYQEYTRYDKIFSVSGDLVYKLNREMQIKAQLRRDALQSNLPGVSTTSSAFTLGVRLQR